MLSFWKKKPVTSDSGPRSRPGFSAEELAAAMDAARDDRTAPATPEHAAAGAAQPALAAAPARQSAAPATEVEVAPAPTVATTIAVPPTPMPTPAMEAASTPVAIDSQTLAQALATIRPVTEAERPATVDHAIVTPRSTVDETGASAATPGPRGWRERLQGSGFARGISALFSRNPKLDDELLDEIETALITADVGIGATNALMDTLRRRMHKREFTDAHALLGALRAELLAMLAPVAVPLVIDRDARPFVILTVGVNGVGKTTTIGKLARLYQNEGRRLMLAAGDTFRAAAVEQLQIWGERNNVPVIAQGQNADPASVAFDGLQAAKARGIEVLIADTAGRLHTQTGLMNELGKIRRVLGRLDPAAPHEVLMVLDGTTGQNAISQVRQFHAAVGVTGLVVTKLDGSAKGGVLFALATEFGIPIRYVGLGERLQDLRVFDPEAFVDALLPDALASASSGG